MANFLRGIGSALSNYGADRAQTMREEEERARQAAALTAQRSYNEGLVADDRAYNEGLVADDRAYREGQAAEQRMHAGKAGKVDLNNRVQGAQAAWQLGGGEPGSLDMVGAAAKGGYTVNPPQPVASDWEGFETADGNMWERDSISGQSRAVNLPNGDQAVGRVPGSGSSSGASGALTFDQAFDRVDDLFATRNSDGFKTGSRLKPNELQTKAFELWQASQNNDEGYFTAEPGSQTQFSIQNAINNLGQYLPEPGSDRSQMGPVGGRQRQRMTPTSQTEQVPGSEAAQLRAMGYSEEQIRLTLGG